MKPYVWVGLLWGWTAALGQVPLPVEFEQAAGWEPRPTYLPNPAAGPEVSVAGGTVTLRVAEPGRGMKFELRLVPLRCSRVPYLGLRYRARDLAGGYALWVYDDSPGGRQLAGVGDLVQDGQWHVLAVDLEGAGAQGSLRSLLTEVQCRTAPASLELDWVRPLGEPPEGARVLAAGAAAPDVTFSGEAWDRAEPRPGWLQEHAAVYTAARSPENTLHLHVEGAPAQGMKWAVPLAAPVDLKPYGYVSVWYRARNVHPYGDYLLWLGSAAGGAPPESQTVLRLNEALSDGQWHVFTAPLRQRFTVRELAFQARTAGGPADLEVRRVAFSCRRPRYPLRELLPEEGDWPAEAVAAAQWEPVELTPAADLAAAEAAREFGLREWLPPGRALVRGVPFEQTDPARAAVCLEGLGERAVAVGAAARELYLLLGCDPTPVDNARMGNPVPLERFSHPERFCVRLEYADGMQTEVFPVQAAAGLCQMTRGVDVYVIPDLRDAVLTRLVLIQRMESGLTALAGLTANRGRALTSWPAPGGLPPPVEAIPAYPGAAVIREEAWGYVVANDLVRLDLGVTGGITLRGIGNRCQFEGVTEAAPGALFEVAAEGVTVGSDRVAAGPPVLRHEGDVWRLTVPVDATPAGVPLQGDFTVAVGDGDGIRLGLELRNASSRTLAPTVRFPVLRDLRLGSLAETWYLYACRGGIVSNRPGSFRTPYGGEYPLQVMSVFSARGGAVGLFTEDTRDVYRFWELSKDDSGVDLSLSTWPQEAAPGETLEITPVVLRTHTGDWRQSLRIYREWTRTWYRPQVPRKDWFRKIFYYQQTNVWSRLRDPATGAWRVADEVRAYREAFGCLDYLHLFDFGESRVHGRVGDYSHYEELGGLEALRSAIREIRQAGARVGLYVEGYLCDERAVWAPDHLAAADIRQQDGTPLLWPGTPTEHMMCSASALWRGHLADVERRVAGELEPDGIYTDQYGFMDPWKTCWSRGHGHPVPFPPIRGEGDTLRALRAAVPEGIATLTEEVPNDLHTVLQDGALAYSVTMSNPAFSPHRVHFSRFMFPDFKTFQLVQYNPFTEGAWHLLKFPFFNGEGYWLHGTVPGSYCEDARQFLREAFRVLRQYEAAFCSEDVEALVPTLAPSVYANRFGQGDLQVWTLYNADWRTYRGPVLRVPRRRGMEYRDAFADAPATVEEEGRFVVIRAELPPHGVGCVAASRARP